MKDASDRERTHEAHEAHEQWQAQLSEHVDGELSPAQGAALEAHLAGCAECSALAADLGALRERARQLGEREAGLPSPEVWRAIEARLEPRPTREARGARGVPLAAALAAAAAVFALGFGVAWLGFARGGFARGGGGPAERVAAGPSFVLLLHEPGGPALDEAATRAAVAEYSAWARGLGERGLLLAGEKLGDEPGWRLAPGAAPEVFAPGSGASVVGGYFVVRARDYAQALELAESCPHLLHGGWIEVRRIEDV